MKVKEKHFVWLKISLSFQRALKEEAKTWRWMGAPSSDVFRNGGINIEVQHYFQDFGMGKQRSNLLPG